MWKWYLQLTDFHSRMFSIDVCAHEYVAIIIFNFLFLEGLSGWSQPVMGNHPMHQQLSDPGTFSQHQPMERDDSGIVAPSNIFHQPMPNSFVDFSKVSCKETAFVTTICISLTNMPLGRWLV